MEVKAVKAVKAVKPTAFLATLMPHQEKAKAWTLAEEKGGCLLCCGMGLGKTLITLSVMVERPKKTLVVLPLSLLSQWEAEIGKHTSGFVLAIHHGDKRAKAPAIKKFAEADVVLTTYNTVWTDYKNGNTGAYAEIERVVFDEAHKLRSHQSNMYKGTRAMFAGVPFKVLLTGTPVCNRMQDIVSLFSLLGREPMNDPSYWKSMSLEEKAEKVVEFRKKVVLYMKTEDTIGDKLPDLKVIDHDIRFEKDGQQDVYEKVLDGSIASKNKLQKILKLRQCANEAKLLVKKGVGKEAVRAGASSELSDKVNLVKRIVGDLPAGDKIVIFSQWLGMLELLRDTVADAGSSLLYHGRMKKEDKDEVVRQFETDPEKRVLFITLKAGSVGLNLNVANHAIMVEPYFNAAEENQAMTRVFRIGQTKPVVVHRIRVSDTVEDWMKQIQKIKGKTAEMILCGKGDVVEIQDAIAEKGGMFEKLVNNNKTPVVAGATVAVKA